MFSHSSFECNASPEHPGWLRWRLTDESLFNEAVIGPILIRQESEDTARVRIFPRPEHRNNGHNVHGAVSLALIDIGLFAAMKLLRDVDAAGAMTLGLDSQFIGRGDPARPLDALVQVLRETGRLGFLRGTVVQDDDLVAAFSATIRKPSQARA